MLLLPFLTRRCLWSRAVRGVKEGPAACYLREPWGLGLIKIFHDWMLWRMPCRYRRAVGVHQAWCQSRRVGLLLREKWHPVGCELLPCCYEFGSIMSREWLDHTCSRKTMQRYDEELVLSKYFRKKMQKKYHLGQKKPKWFKKQKIALGDES